MHYEISIVIPHYNQSKYISDALRSVSLNSNINSQVIIVDDKSQDSEYDNVEEIVSCFQGALNIEIYQNKINLGLAGARNVGTKHVKSDYVMYFDCDDQIPSNALGSLLSHAKKFQSDIVVGKFLTFVEKKKEKIFREPYFLKKEGIFTFLSNGYLSNSPKVVYSVSAWNKLFSMEYIERVNFSFNEEYRFAEDHPSIIPALCCAKSITVIPDVVYWYRKDNEDSLMAQFEKSPQNKINDLLKGIQQNLCILKGLPRYYYSKRILQYEIFSIASMVMKKKLKSEVTHGLKKIIDQIDPVLVSTIGKSLYKKEFNFIKSEVM